MTEKYFDVAIHNNSFCIIESSFKPSSAHTILKKIEFIVKNKLTYDTNHQHHYSSLSNHKIYKILGEKSSQICTGYLEKQEELNWISRLLFSKEKQINEIHTSIENYIRPSRLLPLPTDVIQEIAKELGVSDLGSLAILSRHGETQAKIAFITRAKKYGYEGNDSREACKYLDDLIKEVTTFAKLNLIPKECLAYKDHKIDADQILENLVKLSHEDTINFLLTDKVLDSSCELSSKETKAGIYTREFKNIHKLLFVILKKHLSCTQKIDINKCNARGSTLLMLAAYAGKTEFVELLLEHNADISLFNQKGNNALLVATFSGKKEIVEKLMKQGADPSIPDRTNFFSLPLHRAAACGHVNIVELFLQKGLDINSLDAHGNTPLAYACTLGKNEVAKFLLEQGADHTIATLLYHSSPMHWAAKNGHVEIVKLLIKYGANVNARRVHGETPLTDAKNRKVLKLLKRHGATT